VKERRLNGLGWKEGKGEGDGIVGRMLPERVEVEWNGFLSVVDLFGEWKRWRECGNTIK
jgi:hypothetical protein